MSAVDVILLLLMLAFAISGYRQGFVIGLLSFAGFFAGALIGLQLGPLLAQRFADGATRDLQCGGGSPMAVAWTTDGDLAVAAWDEYEQRPGECTGGETRTETAVEGGEHRRAHGQE